MISLSLGLTENIRGPGLWKLNTSFLSDEEYLKCIKKVILKTCDDYKHDKDVDDALLWEMIKLKLESHQFFTEKKKLRDGPLENLWGGRAKYKKKIRAREN